MAIDPDALPDDPKVMREVIRQVLEQLEDAHRKNEMLRAAFDQMRREKYGRKGEAPDPETQQQLGFIAGSLALKPEPPPPPPPAPPKPPPKGHGRAKIPGNLPRDLFTYDVPEKDRHCRSCRKTLVLIGQEESEQVEHVSASVRVKKRLRLKYGCPNPECRGEVVLAELPVQAVPKCKAAEGMLAFVIWSKYGLHLPLYRLEEILANHGFPVHRSTLWCWLFGAAEALDPVYRVMMEEVRKSKVVAVDETPVRLRDRERDVMKQGRQWAYLNDDHTVFEFTPDRKKKHPEGFLKGVEAYLLSDAYSGFRSIAQASDGKIVNVFCWAHLRRQFWKAMETDRERSLVAVAYIRAIYKVEDEGEGLPPARLRKLRQLKSKPLVDEFKKWLDEQRLMVLPRSPIGKAIKYGVKNWTEFTRFLEDGRLRLDNNHTEQQMRLIALGRKNWLRYESERGGRVAAVFSSLISSCRRQGVNPYEYLRDVLRRIATCPMKKVRDLTPARWKPKPDTS